jgi:hypothetical protein
VSLLVSQRAKSKYHDLGMGWFQSFCAAADAGVSRAVNSVNAMMNFVNRLFFVWQSPSSPMVSGGLLA